MLKTSKINFIKSGAFLRRFWLFFQLYHLATLPGGILSKGSQAQGPLARVSLAWVRALEYRVGRYLAPSVVCFISALQFHISVLVMKVFCHVLKLDAYQPRMLTYRI